MKKVYSKPEIIFEDFALSTNIAGNCEVKTNTPSQMQCAYYSDFDEAVFLDTIQACSTYPSEGVYDGFCYHVPTEDKNLFNS